MNQKPFAITHKIESRLYRNGTNQVTVQCIVGAKSWHISGDSMKNAKLDYWLVDTNVVERRTITSNRHLERAKEYRISPDSAWPTCGRQRQSAFEN
jgi:hypothetical protein